MNPSERTLEAAAALLDERIGLNSDRSFRPRLTRAVRDAAQSLGLDDDQFHVGLRADQTVIEALVGRVTVQETAFFRHPEQFDTIVGELCRDDRPFHAWSAACANGQEAYSLAMLVRERAHGGAVLATDVSPGALERTDSGVYTDREVNGVSPARRARHLVRDGDRWAVGRELRTVVTVRRHNLLDIIPPEVEQCQVVMCRNVLIYFGESHAERFLGRLADVMAPQALLFLGSAETLWHIDDRFEPTAVASGYAYRVRQRRLPAAPRSPIERQIAHPRPRPGPPRSPGGAPIGSLPPAVPVREVTNPRGSTYALIGSELLAAGDVAGAIIEFRKWGYESPKDPTPFLHLGDALRQANDAGAASRAYRTALRVAEECDEACLAEILAGYHPAEFRRMLLERDAIAYAPPPRPHPHRRPTTPHSPRATSRPSMDGTR